MTVAEIDDNSSYIYKSHKDPGNKGCYFKVIIHKEGNYSFHVDKTPERILEDSRQSAFRYPIAEIEIGRHQGGEVADKKSGNSRRRTLYKDWDLDAGEYIVFVKVHYDAQYEKDYDVNLAIYAEFPCEICLASRDEAIAFSQDEGVQWEGEEQENSGNWNNMNGWGNEGNEGNEGNGNQGWGEQPPNNDGWGEQPPNNNDGWGEQQ